ncbi:MAG TPA: hypothetical protein VF895_00040 [Gaiellaceae bacterium]
MEEARQVLERLRRIELLEQEDTPAPAILAEVRELLAEAEKWVREEGRADVRAQAGVDRLREALEQGDETALAAQRTLVA